MKERQELWCHDCSRYVQFDIDVSLNGNHVITCPNCGHEHLRVVETRLFEYAAIYNPTKDEIKDGKKAELVVDVKRVLASNDQVASMIAIKSIPEEYDDRLHQIDIVVRPF